MYQVYTPQQDNYEKQLQFAEDLEEQFQGRGEENLMQKSEGKKDGRREILIEPEEINKG